MRIQTTLLAGLLSMGAVAATAAAWQPSAIAAPAYQDAADTIGDLAPEPNARTWFNHIGAPITLDNLKGKVWIVEKWATW